MMWLNSKNRKTILPIIAGLCLILCSLTGCKEEAPSAQPAVVKKRVEQASQTTAENKEPSKSVVETVQPQPIEKAEPAAKATARKSPADDAETTPAPPMTAQTETTDTPPAAKPTETDTETAQAPDAETEGTAETLSLKDSIMDDTIPKYDPTGKTDPFLALFTEENTSSVSEDTEPKRPLTPLEKIDLSQLQLVAVLQAASGSRAMVEDATGKGYILKAGTFVGLNRGVVTEIHKTRVIIEEKTRDFLGREGTGTKELKLQKPFGEQ